MSTLKSKWLEPHSPLPEMPWSDFLRLMQIEFSIYALPSAKRPGVRLVESPFDPGRGKSIYVVPDNRANIISPKNLVAVLERFEILRQFRDAYNRYFKLLPSGSLPFNTTTDPK
jgi:hypothetical protein